MKAQILKIAGVKTEKEFYKKFPSEAAFMKKHGKELKKAQVGTSIDNVAKPAPMKPISYNTFYDQAQADATGISTQERQRQEALASQAQIAKAMEKKSGPIDQLMSTLGGDNGDIIGNVAGMFKGGGHLPIAQIGATLKSLPIKGLSDSAKALPTLTSPTMSTTESFGSKAKTAGNSLLSQAGSIWGTIEAIGEAQHQQDQQKQFAQISNVTAQAAESQDVDAKRQKRYVRPEDMAFQPGQMGSSYGTGTNYLQARNGAEIQNTFAPNSIYTDLGYEPLNDSNVKQFQFGGIANAAGSWITGGGFEATPEGQLGSQIGGVFGPIGEAAGGFIGGLFGGGRQHETNMLAEQGKQNTMRAAAAGFGNALRGMNSGSMEDGGWVSNDWMPQVIAKFGEYDVKDLLKPPHDADMLRAGGHLKEYTAPSARAMYTGRMDDGGVMHSTNMMFDTDRFPRAEYGTQMAMGGDLQVHRGKAETMSYNPYLPDGGETIMFRGPSHDNGGMPVTFGENGVEVEGGEPAVKLQDGGSPDGNLVVFGDMFMPGQKKKFKHYAADLSKTEAKQNKIVDKSTKLVNDLDVNTEFDKLSLQAANANILGANMKLKDIAKQKTEAATLQNAILDTASEQGLVAADLAKGKIVKDKEAMKKAKFGAKMETAQTGSALKFMPSNIIPGNMNYPQAPIDVRTMFAPDAYSPIGGMENEIKNLAYTPYEATIVAPKDVPPVFNEETAKAAQEKAKGKGFNWKDAALFAQSVAPFVRPTNQEPLDPAQIAAENFALASNQLEPVQAQLYTPQLNTPYDISLQDQLNANQADFNAMQRTLGNNPELLTGLAAQKYAANQSVLGNQTRANQAERARVYEANRQTLNEAQRVNLGILDQQFNRQSIGKSKTKQEAQTALQSIASKMAQHELANKTLGIYENMYNYRYAPGGQAYNLNAPYSFNIPTVGSGAKSTSDIALTEAERLQALADAQKIKEANAKSKKNARNGSIVKAIKGL
jgi:hypothetical protein